VIWDDCPACFTAGTRHPVGLPRVTGHYCGVISASESEASPSSDPSAPSNSHFKYLGAETDGVTIDFNNIADALVNFA